MPRASRETWAKRVERWNESGLSAAQFANETGVNAKTLAFWKWRLGRDAGTKRGSRPPKFVEVSPAALLAEVVTDVEPLEVIVRDTVRIRVPSRCDFEAVRRLVAALERR
jgi:transposase